VQLAHQTVKKIEKNKLGTATAFAIQSRFSFVWSTERITWRH